MSVRETSLRAYRDLEDSGLLQDQERELMKVIHRRFLYPAKFTRKDLVTPEWPVNVVAGRVNSLIKKRFLNEFPETRDGGHLLSIASPKTAAPAPLTVGESAPAGGPATPSAAATVLPPEAAVPERPVYDKNGELLCYAVGIGPGWPMDQDHLHRGRR